MVMDRERQENSETGLEGNISRTRLPANLLGHRLATKWPRPRVSIEGGGLVDACLPPRTVSELTPRQFLGVLALARAVDPRKRACGRL